MKYLVTLSFLISTLAFGWGDIGHKAVAEIAERNLSEKAKIMVFDILGAEPLAVASIFPDLVKSDKRYQLFSPYHYLEIRPGDTAEGSVAASVGKKTAHIILSKVAPLLSHSKDMAREEKAFLFKYLIHVVGDVHQPLHVGNGVDQGGNLCNVKWQDPETGTISTNNLHVVWDERLMDYFRYEFKKMNIAAGTNKYFDYPELILLLEAEFQKILANEKLDLNLVKKDTVLKWYTEAQTFYPVVYPDVNPGQKPELRPYCRRVDWQTGKIVDGVYDASKLPTLDEAYAKRALPLISRQIFVGGYRLAEILNQIALTYKPSQSDPDALNKVFEAAQLEKKSVSLKSHSLPKARKGSK